MVYNAKGVPRGANARRRNEGKRANDGILLIEEYDTKLSVQRALGGYNGPTTTTTRV